MKKNFSLTFKWAMVSGGHKWKSNLMIHKTSWNVSKTHSVRDLKIICGKIPSCTVSTILHADNFVKIGRYDILRLDILILTRIPVLAYMGMYMRQQILDFMYIKVTLCKSSTLHAPSLDIQGLLPAKKVWNFQLFRMYFSSSCLYTSLLSQAITFNELHSAFN